MLDIVACPSYLLPQPDRKRKVLQQKPSDPYCTQQHAWAAVHLCPEVLELLQAFACSEVHTSAENCTVGSSSLPS